MLMHKPLAGRKVAILIGNGFEEVQMTDMQRALIAAGASAKIVSTSNGLVNGWQGTGWGHYYPVDQQVSETLAADFDMLVLPDGERSLTKLLHTAHSLRIVRGFRDAGKPVAAVGFGASLIVEAGRATDLAIVVEETGRAKAETAGAKLSTETMVTDDSVLTAASTVDMPGFIEAMVSLFATANDALKSAA
jgi:protease I